MVSQVCPFFRIEKAFFRIQDFFSIFIFIAKLRIDMEKGGAGFHVTRVGSFCKEKDRFILIFISADAPPEEIAQLVLCIPIARGRRFQGP